jgi:serine/threonine-protein kinase
MPLSSGSRLGAYEIVAAIGAGGMGEVYRARDTRLNRDVALKILPELFADDVERLARLHREAQLLASLNHPNIAAIYGLEGQEGRDGQESPLALVLELIEGPTLADRIASGRIAIDEALVIARQVADALEAAHERGVIHRDLKPANIKVPPDGRVKVLDFGLAKAMTAEEAAGAGRAALTHSPTLSMMATQAGMILGTAAYMSPEQAQGLPVDHRTDVFSFGVVLYEMLSGRQPFHGETAAAILASVLIRDADLNALPPNLSRRLVDLIRRCLEKNPKQRWHAAGDLRVELEAVAEAPLALPAPPAAAPAPLWKRAAAMAAVAVGAAALTSAAWWYSRPPAAPPPIVSRFAIVLAQNQQFTNTGRHVVALSPDGTEMVYVANQQLFLRSMSDPIARPIAGTNLGGGITEPVFSPDGQSLAFWANADNTIKRIAVTGGAAFTICSALNPFGMTWDASGIMFGQGPSRSIVRVSPNGGTPETIVKADTIPHGPQMLPDGDTLLFTLGGAAETDRWEKAQIVTQSLKTGARRVLVESGTDARYVASGHIVFAIGGVLFAVPFDARKLAVSGGKVPVVEGVSRADVTITGSAQYSVSRNGSLIYLPGPISTAIAQRDLALVDRNGSVTLMKLPLAPYEHPRLSPDGKQIAVGSDDQQTAIVWVYGTTGTTARRQLTFGGRNRFPIWSADSTRVAFQSNRDGDLAIFWQRADGTGSAERLTRPDKDVAHIPQAWSPAGDRLLVDVVSGRGHSLSVFSMLDRKLEPFDGVRSAAMLSAAFSPDGRFVSYDSNEFSEASALTRLYVQPFPATGAKYVIPLGIHAVWSHDGKKLFSQRRAGMAVVDITTRPAFAFGNPVEFVRPFLSAGPETTTNFDITADDRFLAVINAGQGDLSSAPQVDVVLNWLEDLKQRVPVK